MNPPAIANSIKLIFSKNIATKFLLKGKGAPPLAGLLKYFVAL